MPSTPHQPLSLVDDDASSPVTPTVAPASAAPAGEARAAPVRDLRITNADEFLAEAVREYEAGRVDQAVWARSAAQAGGDEALAVAAYLRARATALRLAKRTDRRAAAPQAPAAAAPAAPEAAKPRPAKDDTRTRAAMPRKAIAVAGGAAALLCIGVVAWLVVRAPAAEPPAQSHAAVAPAARPKATPPVSAAALAATAVPAEPSFAERIAELRRANNWNVLVLYATEWTRKEPGNAQAWSDLADGYVRLSQLPDAFEAARRAAALAPEAVERWRALGSIAAGLDRWPDAHAAYDRLLALAPDDTPALCASAMVARREGRTADGDALVRKVAAGGSSCSDVPAMNVAASASLPTASAGASASIPAANASASPASAGARAGVAAAAVKRGR